ncbi:MAG TPA: hypothetical protein VNW73_16250, partial [Ktedonobacteraceae bacterium]|nr:hypothetical protein [Ktedonobacteraceae bacterium]
SLTRQPISEQSSGILQERSDVFLQSQALVGPAHAWNVQSHLQVGSVPYRVSRKGEKALVRRRRQDRLQRMGYKGMMQRSAEAWQSPLAPEEMVFLPKPCTEVTEMRSR